MPVPIAPHRVVALIGDIVASKQAPDRAALQKRLVTVLRAVNEAVPSIQPLEPTLGDEFQAVYETLG